MHRTFDGPRRNGRASEFHPYLFHREPADVIEEAFSELLHHRSRPARAAGEDGEHAAVREQRWTLFAYDEAMQQVFSGDFDAFCAALDDPKRMDERLREARRRMVRGASKTRGASTAPERLWGTSHVHEHVHEHGDDHEHAPLDDDPVYDGAFRWACRTERWSRRLYFAQRTRDRDLFRVFLNAPLVPAKVAFAFFGSLDDDLAGCEVALIGYRQAGIFLGRTMDSLANCYGKRIGREQTVHELLDEGRELLADIESKLAEIESEIRHRGGRRKSP